MRKSFVDAVHSNLRNLGVDALDVVNLRVGPPLIPEDGSIAEPFGVLVDLQKKGLIRHLGLSTVSSMQVAEARKIAPIVCVQNLYNVANRKDDALVGELAALGIAYVPYFPLGGFTPLQSSTLDDVAGSIGGSPMQVALAWLLQRSPNVLLIPGTSSLKHLHENLKARALELTAEMVTRLDAIGAPNGPRPIASS